MVKTITALLGLALAMPSTVMGQPRMAPADQVIKTWIFDTEPGIESAPWVCRTRRGVAGDRQCRHDSSRLATITSAELGWAVSSGVGRDHRNGRRRPLGSVLMLEACAAIVKARCWILLTARGRPRLIDAEHRS